MLRNVIIGTVLLFGAALGGCQAQPFLIAPAVPQAQDSTNQAAIQALTERVVALEQRIDDLEEMDHDSDTDMDEGQHLPQAFQVAVALYLLDTVGFHSLDDRINGEGIIEASDAAVVGRVERVLAATDWPETLQSHADELTDVLNHYAEALSADDLESAKPLAGDAHDIQHDLSHEIQDWLNKPDTGEHEHNSD